MTRETHSTRSSEHAEQAAVVQWARWQEYRCPDLRWLMAIPNGAKLPYRYNRVGQRYSPEASKLKGEGLLKGAADMLLPVPRRGYHGLWIEMKYGKNTLSDEQQEFLEGMLGQGYLAVACWGADQAIETLREYLGLSA